MADLDPNSSEHNIWSTVNGSYRRHIRFKRVVAAAIIVLLLAPLTYLIVSQILQNRSSISAVPTGAAIVEAQIDQVTPTEILSQSIDVTNAPDVAQPVSVTPIMLPSETAIAVPVVDTSTAAARTTPQPTPAPIQTQIPQPTTTATTSAQNVAASTSTSTPRPTNTLRPTTTSVAAAHSVSTTSAQNAAASTSTSTPRPTNTLRPTTTSIAAAHSVSTTPQVLNPATGGETPGLNLFQILGLVLLSMVLILLGSALIAQPARR